MPHQKDHLEMAMDILTEARAINDLDFLNRNQLAYGAHPALINREVSKCIERAAFHIAAARG